MAQSEMSQFWIGSWKKFSRSLSNASAVMEAKTFHPLFCGFGRYRQARLFHYLNCLHTLSPSRLNRFFFRRLNDLRNWNYVIQTIGWGETKTKNENKGNGFIGAHRWVSAIASHATTLFLFHFSFVWAAFEDSIASLETITGWSLSKPTDVETHKSTRADFQLMAIDDNCGAVNRFYLETNEAVMIVRKNRHKETLRWCNI